MKIGLISDTHGFLDKKVFEFFEDCDEIWHAGDIGEGDIDIQLRNFKRFKAVFGNIDTRELQAAYPEDFRFNCEGFDILITHIAGSPPNYKPRVKKIIKEKTPDILICGHSHILKVLRDPQFNNMLFINPGAAGNHGFHQMKTLIRLELKNREVKKMEVIELGKRGLVKG